MLRALRYTRGYAAADLPHHKEVRDALQEQLRWWNPVKLQEMVIKCVGPDHMWSDPPLETITKEGNRTALREDAEFKGHVLIFWTGGENPQDPSRC